MEKRLITKVLEECNTELIQGLIPDQLIEYCLTKGVISGFERAHVRGISLNTFTQTGELLDILRKKDDSALDVLLEYLKANGSQTYLIEKLEASKQKHAATTTEAQPAVPVANDELELTFNDVRKIVRILVEDPTMIQEWNQVKDVFVEKAMDRFVVERRLQEGKIYEAMVQTFELWISKKGVDATFKKLLTNLQEYQAVVGKLREMDLTNE